LVRLAKDKDEQSVDVTKLKKQLTILTQKKARTEGTCIVNLECSLFLLTLSLPDGYCFINYLFARGLSKKLLYY
jgi:hypothetical protein